MNLSVFTPLSMRISLRGGVFVGLIAISIAVTHPWGTTVAGPSSDAFWNRFSMIAGEEAVDGLDFRSLEEMTTASDLVIRGRMADIYIGRHWVFSSEEPAVPILYANIAIDEVLKGVPVSRIPGTVEMGLHPVGDNFDLDEYTVPSEEYIWFLTFEPIWRAKHSQPPLLDDSAPFTYFRFNHHQTVLRNLNGQVDVLELDQIKASYGDQSFPVALDGTSFAELVTSVRSAAVTLEAHEPANP
jgi:hypothetical protein